MPRRLHQIDPERRFAPGGLFLRTGGGGCPAAAGRPERIRGDRERVPRAPVDAYRFRYVRRQRRGAALPSMERWRVPSRTPLPPPKQPIAHFRLTAPQPVYVCDPQPSPEAGTKATEAVSDAHRSAARAAAPLRRRRGVGSSGSGSRRRRRGECPIRCRGVGILSVGPTVFTTQEQQQQRATANYFM